MDKCPECSAPVDAQDKICNACGTILVHLEPEVIAHINLLRKMVEKEPTNVKNLLDLGDLYHKYGFIKEALNTYKAVVERDSTNFEAYAKRANLYLELKELNEAEISFRSALHLNPKSTEMLIGLFRVYYLQNKTDEAIVLGEKILQILPNNVEFHILLKNLYLQKGDKAKVLTELEALERLTPDNVQNIKDLVYYHLENNNIVKVINYYEKLVNLHIRDILIDFQIGKYYYDNRQYDRAVEYFTNAFKFENIGPAMETLIKTYLALTYFAQGNRPIAEDFVNQIDRATSQQMDRSDQKRLAALFFKLGEYALQENKIKKGINYLETAVSYDIDSVEYQQLLEKTRKEIYLSSRKSLKKALTIAAGIASLIVVVAFLWILSHNKILIQVTPGGNLKVLLDGKHITPHQGKSGFISTPSVLIGRHTIEIEKDGYERWQEDVYVGFAKNGFVRVNLVPAYGGLKVVSEPESADVYLDQKFIGHTPFVADNIPVSNYRLEIRKDGYLTYTRFVNITKNSILDLGKIHLEDLGGTWQGEIGQDASGYEASFNMTIRQEGSRLKIKYYHRPSDGLIYTGEIKGTVVKDEFVAEGSINCRYLNVFYWTNTKKKISMKGKISADWERIEGTQNIEDFGTHNWWAEHKK